MAQRTCSVDDCESVAVARGWCRHHYNQWHRYGDPGGRPDPVCQRCGSTFQRRNLNGPVPLYCSRGCERERRPILDNCRCCGASFERCGTKRLFCSIRCRDRFHRNGGMSVPNAQPCVHCGQPIDMLEVGPGGRTKRRDALACYSCRRDVRYELTVEQIVERDGVPCALCGSPVDVSLQFPDRMCAVRDHILPVSLGGGNEAENLQLAHLSCNSRKCNRIA